MSSIATDNYLPSELLLTIFDYLEYDDLYRLANVSSRFNHLSLVVYFAKRKVTISPDGHIDLPHPIRTMEMLPYLRRAPFVKSINRFSCGLLQPHKSFLDNISHLIAILRNVDSVEEFSIDFFVSSESWTPAMIKQANAGNALVMGLSELLTAAAGVSRSVMIRNGTALANVLHKADRGKSITSPTSGLSWPFGQVSRLFTSDKTSKTSKTRKRTSTSTITSITRAPCSSFSYPAPTKGALQALEINSIILLSPPFLDWTIQTLNRNDITDLTFGTIEYRDVDWLGVLSQIHIPTLKSLTFRGYTPFRALIEFMARHQNITTLTVNNINLDGWNCAAPSTPSLVLPDDMGDVFEKLPKAFMNVEKLTCCPQGLAILLSNFPYTNTTKGDGTIAANLFPNLQTISVLWSIGIGQQLKMSIVGDILAPVAHVLKSYEVTFVITYRADVGASWRAPPLAVPGMAPSRMGLSAGNNFSSFGPATINNAHSGANADHGSPTASPLACFTEVKLEVTSKADKEGIPDLIKGLGESLINVKHLQVDTRLRAGRSPQETKSLKLCLCHHALKQFKQLRAVTIDGVRTEIFERGDEI